jgi:hypothetical protein
MPSSPAPSLPTRIRGSLSAIARPLHTTWLPRSCRTSSMIAAFMHYGSVLEKLL